MPESIRLQPFLADTQLTGYMPIPRALIRMDLPSTAVLIYAALLDRGTLSRKNSYTDAQGWVYVVYTEEDLSRDLGISTRVVRKHTKTLESAGLLRKHRSSVKQANRLFLMIPSDSVTGTGSGTGCPVDRNFSSNQTGHTGPPNNLKEQHNFINLYQHSEEESL